MITDLLSIRTDSHSRCWCSTSMSSAFNSRAMWNKCHPLINNNNYYYFYLWKLCWATRELLRKWLFPALQTHFMPTRRLCQPKLDSTSPCLSPSCLPGMQLQALASCQAPLPTLCACALHACSYSATIRACFLSNSLHSSVRKLIYLSFKPPVHAIHIILTPQLLGMATAVRESKKVAGGSLTYRPSFLETDSLSSILSWT